MANINLSKQDLYEERLFEAARAHFQSLSMNTKRNLDREATFFRKHAVTLHSKIDDAYTRQKAFTFVMGTSSNHARVVTIFQGEQFSSMTQLNKQVQKHLKKIEPFVKIDDKEKINFNIVGATANLDRATGGTDNLIIACGEFVSSAFIHNFCHVE
jgi:hypothetical protein